MMGLQPVSDLAQSPVAQTVVGMVNLVGIAAVYAQGWRHRLKAKEEVDNLALKVQSMDTKLEQTVQDSVCMVRMKQVENVVRSENEKLRDEVTALGLSRNGYVADLDVRVRAVENWQARHGGKDELPRDEGASSD